MRLVIDALLTIISIFLAFKLEWPIYLLVIPAYVLAMNVSLISWGRRFGMSRRVQWVLGGFVAVALVFSHALYMAVPATFGAPLTGEGATSLYNFSFDPDRVRVLWSFLGGAALAVATMALVLVIIALIAGFAMYHTSPQYQGYEGEAARSGLNLALGLENGYMYIEDAKIEQVREPKGLLARFGGPGRLVVRLGHAVVLEQYGRPSRVVGSGLTFLQPFERVSMIVPLYGRGATITVRDVETKDRATIKKFEFLVFHRADPGTKEHQILDGPMAYNRHVILNKIWAPDASDWVGVVRSVGEATARDLIGRRKLEEIIPMADTRRAEFKEALKNAINKVTENLGVVVSVVEIGDIEIPMEIKEKLLDRWTADWESHAQLTRAETANSIQIAEAFARSQTITAIAQGLKTLLGDDASPQNLVALRYIEYLEHRAAGTPFEAEKEVDTLIQLQALDTLKTLQMKTNGQAP